MEKTPKSIAKYGAMMLAVGVFIIGVGFASPTLVSLLQPPSTGSQVPLRLVSLVADVTQSVTFFIGAVLVGGATFIVFPVAGALAFVQVLEKYRPSPSSERNGNTPTGIA